MKSYDLLVLVVFIPEGRPQQRILLLGGRLAKLASDLVRVFASLDRGSRFLRQFGSRQDRAFAGRISAVTAAGRAAGGHITTAIGATAKDGPVSAGRAPAKALIGGRADAASGHGLLLGAHDFVEVFQGFVEYAFRLGCAARGTAAAGAASRPGTLLPSATLGVAAGSTVAGFSTAGLARIATLTAVTFLALAASALTVLALTAGLTGITALTVSGSFLTGVFLTLAAALTVLALTASLTGITALAVTGTVLTLGITLLTARLTTDAVTLTTRLGALRTAGGEGRSTTR